MKIKALVIAGSYLEFIFWIRKYGFDKREYKYIRTFEDYAGFHNIPILLIGQYWKNDLDPFSVACEVQQFES